ncbi:MAG: restriction endonuclease subunit S [Bacteroidota bacterium]
MMENYNSYKESGVEWIGKIPSHWGSSKFKYVSSLYTGNSLNDEQKVFYESENPDDLPYVSSKDIDVNFRTVNYDNGLRIPKNNNPLKVSPKGSFLLCVEGGSSGRKMVFLDRDVCFVNKLCSFYSKENTKFQYYLIQSFQFQDKFKLSLTGLIGGVSISTLRNFELPIPPLPEQQQIVSFLDKKISLIDSLIEKTQKKIDLLKEQRTTLINEVVTKGLNPYVEFKDSGVEWIGETPSHWILIRLHTLVTTQKLEFQDGNHGGLHPVPKEFMETGVPFIKPKDIQNESVLWSNCDRLPLKRCEEFRIGFSYNDDVLLVNRGGSIGKVVYVNNYDMEYPYFVINPQVTYMRGKNGLSSKFMFYISLSNIFRCGVDLILGHGSTFPFLGLSNMGDFEMVLPPPIEQQEIVEFLDKKTNLIDSNISIEKKRIEHLKEYRQSLISEVVTGKIKVTD